jgi:hypothetical protein
VPIENRPLQALARRASASADASDTPRLAQADRWPKAFTPIEIGLPRRLRAGRRPSPTRGTFFGRRRPTVGRRPSRRLKSAFPGACAPGVGRRRRKERFSVGAGRPLAEGLRRPNSFGAPRAARRPPPTQARLPGRRRPTVGRRPSRRLKSAFPGACAPGVGLRRRKERFSVGAGRPLAEGLRRPNSFGAPRAERQPPPTQARLPGRRRPTVGRRPQEAEFIRRPPRRASASADASDAPRSAQADRWPKAFTPIEIGLPRRLRAERRPSPTRGTFFGRRRPTVGQRSQEAEFIRRPPRRASASADASDAPRSAQADRWPKASSGRIHPTHRPTVGRRPPKVEFIGRARAPLLPYGTGS